jgi:rsbT co-antagonist protein RsbR
MASTTILHGVLTRSGGEILDEWIRFQAGVMSRGTITESDLREQCRRFLALVTAALGAGGREGVLGNQWAEVRAFLGEMSRTRAQRGFTPSETASFVFSLKQALFDQLRKELAKDAQALADEIWSATMILDGLGLYTTEAHLKMREELIQRQQQELMELSTPVVRLWENVLALPLIGTLDSARTQVVMENLLDQIVSSGAAIAIIDITGVPTVDTLVAQHLLKTVAAARLMGADCIISGIRPQIAQTIVHLGVNLGDVTTKATLADAFAIALRRTGKLVVAAKPAGA